ncbi:MAG: nuclear transport factor 2 family protein [Candidatus Binatia bacterium]
MSAEANKKVVLAFLENLSAGKAQEMFGAMADTLTWWVAGKPEKFALAGTKTKAQMVELLGGLGAKLPKGLKVTPKAMTAEGDRVAVEAESYGEVVGGKVYNNHYHFLFEVRDGKIQAVKEYMDTMHANEVLLG